MPSKLLPQWCHQFFGGIGKAEPPLSILSNYIHYKQIYLTGSHGSTPAQHKTALSYIKQGLVSVDDIIPMNSILKMSLMVCSGIQRQGIKVIITPWGVLLMSTEDKDTVQISASKCVSMAQRQRAVGSTGKAQYRLSSLGCCRRRFAPDFTMGSSIINSFRANTKIQSDYHIMAEEPSNLFDSFECTPGDMFTIHQECSRNLHRDLVRVRRCGFGVGVAINPATSLSAQLYSEELCCACDDCQSRF